MGRRAELKRVHIDGEEWTYVVGCSIVSIRDPQGKRHHIHRHKIVRGHPHNAEAGFDPDAFDVHRHTFTYPTPGIVKNYIWRKLRPGGLIKVPGDAEQAKEIILNYFLGENKEFAGA